MIIKKLISKLNKRKIAVIFGIILALFISFFLIGSISSAISGNGKIKIVKAQEVFRLGEEPIFVFGYNEEKNIFEKFSSRVLSIFKNKKSEIKTSVKVFDHDNLEVDDFKPVIENKKGKISVNLDKSRFQNELKPGKYKLKFEINDNGKTYVKEQDFIWGVLAINTNKSIYLPNEKAYLQFAVLDDGGKTICDANLNLEIRNSKFEIRNLSTKDGSIQYSGKCFGDNVTDVPDYFAHYKVNGPGKYEMTLTNLDNGYKIIDYFEVRESVEFDIERVGPTRIWPQADYEMKIIIKANQDFKGEIIETVPFTFVTENVSGENFFRNDPNINTYAKEIGWEVSLKKGETREFVYSFDALDISPYFYLLGPLQLKSKCQNPNCSEIVFTEQRQWQIAADATAVYDLNTAGATAWDQGNVDESADPHTKVPYDYGAPEGAWTQVTSTNLTYIQSDNGTCFNNAGSSGDFTPLQVKFSSIAQDPESVTQIDLFFDGSGGTAGNTLQAWIWDFTNNVWVQAGSTYTTTGSGCSNETFTGSITTNLANYIHETDGMYVLWMNDVAAAALYVDYVSVTLTYNQLATVTLNDVPFNGERLADTTPDFEFSASDPDGTADITYQIQIDNDSDFSSVIINCESDTSCATGAGSFTGGDGDPFAEEVVTSFTPTTELSDGTTYYWRVRAEDVAGGGGSGKYGAWAEASFTVNTSVTTSDFFQTTDEQFEINTLANTQANGSGQVRIPPATTYTYSSVVAADSIPNSYKVDVDVFPFAGISANLNSKIEATNTNYTEVAANDGTAWSLGTQNSSDEWFVWNDMHIDQTVSQITQIDFTYNGTVGATGNVSIYVLKHRRAEAWFGGNGTWDIVGSVMSFTGGAENTITRSLTSNISDYIDEDGNITWGIAEAASATSMTVDYIEMVVTIATPTVGTIISTPIDYDWVSGATGWDELVFTDTETSSDIKYDIEYWDGDSWEDTSIVNQDTSPVDISSLSPVTHNQIRIVATLTNEGASPLLSDWAITWATAGGTDTTTQTHFRWRNDNGNETTAAWKRGENQSHSSQARSENMRLRFAIANTGDAATSNSSYVLQVAPQGGYGNCESVPSASYSDVPTTTAGCGSSVACMTASDNFINQASTTTQMTATGTFVAGKMVEDPSNQSDAITINASYYTEHEYNFQFTSSAVNNTNYCFRVTKNGTLLDAYTRVAQITVESTGTENTFLNRLKGGLKIKGGVKIF